MTVARRRIGRAISPIILKALRFHSRLTGQKRARVLVRSHQGEVLLVWQTIGRSYWSMPGGGVKRNEDPAVAAVRELHEELGISVDPSALQWLTTFSNSDTGIGYDAILFTVKIDKEALPTKLYNPFEIVEVAWFSPDNLPEPLSPLVVPSLDKLSK